MFVLRQNGRNQARQTLVLVYFIKKFVTNNILILRNNGKALRLTAKEWSELDRYGFVYSEVDWEKGTQDEQSFFHRKCSKNMQKTGYMSKR